MTTEPEFLGLDSENNRIYAGDQAVIIVHPLMAELHSGEIVTVVGRNTVPVPADINAWAMLLLEPGGAWVEISTLTGRRGSHTRVLLKREREPGATTIAENTTYEDEDN